jgi:hypothetical protein
LNFHFHFLSLFFLWNWGSNMWSQVKDVGLFWLCASPMINLLWNLCTEDGQEVERWLEEELDDHKLDRWWQ